METKKRSLVFATQNQNKAKEIQGLLPDYVQVKTLKDIQCTDDIPETQPDLAGNALQKARYIYDKYNVDCFADDTGLEIDALNGEPGIYSARYAGPEKDSEQNMDLVLKKLSQYTDRKAQFRTVIALILDGKEYLFEGIVIGEIRKERCGMEGFGYDPIFEPENYGKTFAEMSLSEKNQRSHRSRAIEKLKDFLEEIKAS
ncbi:non-canonical purine NTP pyrophosphatase [Brumimicrobium salinarum]|uniref:dITP/XTP pyrophosphatase n=1 Tax=Brumimicrobium salinarum TaxID=2058658 RepID=A0A2I0QZK6_9FLAO|nr:non-canonical purine NTP diphosphatase [Brumimicrobium salinarum]PKR79737.1 non-canonical purine NTP pyrophosphatase [Brumimicrobium salinarum]